MSLIVDLFNFFSQLFVFSDMLRGLSGLTGAAIGSAATYFYLKCEKENEKAFSPNPLLIKAPFWGSQEPPKPAIQEGQSAVVIAQGGFPSTVNFKFPNKKFTFFKKIFKNN